ncbi:MAG TPA: hypothetical protein VIO64_00640 [Pseudobacteroides sp.]|uniref:hypothetical protein n=1 Tax=Pseudobacteroides sp. TaxID=1968840 RepID=UPI002F9276D1
MDEKGLLGADDTNDTKNQSSAGDKMSIIDIKQRKYSYFKNLRGELKKDEFDYKKHERSMKTKRFLLLLPFRVIFFLVVFMSFLFFFIIFLYEIGIIKSPGGW